MMETGPRRLLLWWIYIFGVAGANGEQNANPSEFRHFSALVRRHVTWTMDAWLKADGRSLYATTSMRLDSLRLSLSLSLSLSSDLPQLPNRNSFFPPPEQNEELILCELVYNKPVVNSPSDYTVIALFR